MKVISKSRYVLMIIDALIFALATVFTANRYQIPKEIVILTTVLFVFLGIYILFMKGFYKLQKYEMELKDAYLLLEGVVLAAVIPFVTVLFFDFGWTSYKFFLEDIALSYVLILVWRCIFYFHRKYFKAATNLIIVGAGDAGKTIATEILNRPMLKMNIVGFIDNDENQEKFNFENIKVIGRTSELEKIIEKYDVKTIITAIDSQFDYQTRMDLSECVPQGIAIWRMSSFYEKITQKIPVLIITPEWFMYEFTSIDRPLYEFLKRLFDIIAALIILVVTLPIEIICALSIKFADGGPIFYYQERIGKNNKPFKMIKLRTMIQTAEEDGAVWAADNNNDPRVLPIGKIARKARFDEIPQMINVLKGEMSIVGPRPERPEFVEILNKEIPFYNRRHWIAPGWTGWAQIMYKYGASIEDATEKLRYDFYYIKHRNIFWDISILIKAIMMALTGRHD